MDFNKYEPKLELADKYEKIEEWFCDECHADQVYVGDGRMMCAELDCKNLFGNNDSQEHMTGSYADMNDLSGHQVEERIRKWDSRLLTIINQKDIDRMIEELIDIYKKDWDNPDKTTASLVEELEMAHRRGVKGFDSMSYDEIQYEYNDQLEHFVNYMDNDD